MTKTFFPIRQDTFRKSKGGMKNSDLGHIPVWRLALACVRAKWDRIHAQRATEMNAAI